MELSEMAQRVLCELEEAGEDSIVTLLNTVTERTGSQAERRLVQDALRSLIAAGLVEMAAERDISRRWKRMTGRESLAVVEESSAWLEFREHDRHWADKRSAGPPFTFVGPHALTTKQGKALAVKIIDHRGYQWWRSSTS